MRLLPVLSVAFALGCGRAAAGWLPDNPFSNDARGLCGAQFLKVPPSARFAALGGAGLTLDGQDSFFLNPAGAAPAGRGAATASYESLLEGASRTGLAVSRASGPEAFSAGLVYQNSSPGLDYLDGAGNASGGEIPAYDAAFGAGWSRRAAWGRFGASLKYVRSRLADASGATGALDAGFVLKDPSPSVADAALAVRNFGPPLKLGSRKAPLPLELAGGLRFKYAPDVNFYMEGRLPVDHSPYLIFAGEWFLGPSPLSGFFLRSGLNFRNYGDHGFMGAFAGGFGLKLGSFAADYAFSPYGELGAAHRMTLGYAWGAPAAPAPRSRALPAKAVVAVAPFLAGDGVTQTEAEVVRNLVESELGKTGRFLPVNRATLDFILEEKKLAYSGLQQARAAGELAAGSGADLGVFGTVYRVKDGYVVEVGMADPGGEVLARRSEPAPEDYLFRDASRRAVAALAAR